MKIVFKHKLKKKVSFMGMAEKKKKKKRKAFSFEKPIRQCQTYFLNLAIKIIREKLIVGIELPHSLNAFCTATENMWSLAL